MVGAFLSLYLHLSACILHLRTVPLPSVDRSTRPTSVFSPLNPLRIRLLEVAVPSALSSSFLIHAQWNTRDNTETCGILAGRKVSILLTTLGRYVTVASVGTFCFSPMVRGIK